MTAGHEGAGEYAGMDALMAAITGEPLPEEARQDAAYLTEHRSAEADVAVLREQLTWLAEALAGEARLPGEEAEGTEAEGTEAEGTEAEEAEAEEAEAEEAEAEEAEAEGGEAEGATGTSAAAGKSVAPATRPRSVTRPVGPARPARPPRPGRPPRPRRALRLALGLLAGAAAFSMAAGLGWLVTHSGAGDSMGGSSADAKSAADAPAKVSGEGGRPDDPALALACYRLVVEGTVAEVEPKPGSPRTRIVLTVSRSYKPAHTPAEVSFLLDGGAQPAPRKGQHVLVGVGQGQDDASLWAVGDTRVAADRAWITEALPEARHTTCPSDDEEPTGTP
ncbi:hypothetical protein AQI88_25485 [Streptomyces cellostaticus]|uniref:Uncharacterized protein n=1 Tax=Streptomyces cellostaticus TaxID=67285 RepID=A0A124HC99_9ACTN|nr:hypothetical protein [Streptomyces cellostaticus]KUM93757.1 hypothetical protein AQI88_25485 [Streptomyces cellostaticus]GHI07672.1 hypothetical protein Scel_59930 [Streptomyces cellostaticus]